MKLYTMEDQERVTKKYNEFRKDAVNRTVLLDLGKKDLFLPITKKAAKHLFWDFPLLRWFDFTEGIVVILLDYSDMNIRLDW